MGGYYFEHRPSSQSNYRDQLFPKGQSEQVLPLFDPEEGDRSSCRNTVGRLACDDAQKISQVCDNEYNQNYLKTDTAGASAT